MTSKTARWLLSIAASIGVAGTAVAAADASFKVAKLNLSPKKAAKYYIPTAVTGLLTIGCIIGSNIIGDRENAILSAALLVAEEGYVRRKEKSDAAVKKMTEDHKDKLQSISKSIERRAIAPRIRRDELLWYDGLRGPDGYFGATELDIWIALYFLNREMQQRESGHAVSLAYLYETLGLSAPPWSYDVGWSLGAGVVYGYETIDFSYETLPYNDSTTYNLLSFPYPPTHDYLWYTPDEAKHQGWEE